MVKRFLTLLKNNNFLKSVLTLSSGVVFAQAINFFGMPFIGRIYSPDTIGDYTLITSNASVISAIATLGMMTVFMLPKKNDEAKGLCKMVTGALIIISSVFIVALMLLSKNLRIFEPDGVSYKVALIVLWLYVIFYNISNICYAYVNRQKMYSVMFWNPIIAAVVNVGLGSILGLLGCGFLGYTLAHIVSFVINIIHLTVHANPYSRQVQEVYKWKILFKRYDRFIKYQMPSNLINNISNQVPITMINTLFGSSILGAYSMALKILSLPTLLLATPINRVYFQEASERYNNGNDIGEFTFNIIKTNIKLAIIPISALIVFGESIFGMFLGAEWRLAGTYAAVLGLYELIKFISACTAGGFVILKYNSINLASSIISLSLNLTILLITKIYLAEDFIICLILISAVGIIYDLCIHGLFFKLANFSVNKYLNFIAIYILIPVAVSFLLRYIMTEVIF